MSIYQIDNNKPFNNFSSIIKSQYNYHYDSVTLNKSASRYIVSSSFLSDIKNNFFGSGTNISNITKSIRSTLTCESIVNNKFDFYSGSFENNYPEVDLYNLCDQKLSSIFNYSNKFYSSSENHLSGHPYTKDYGLTKDLMGDFDCSTEFECYVDPASGQCGQPPVCVSVAPQNIVIPPNLKSTIKGYAFYLDYIREVNIPNVGNRRVMCAGGHYCCSTNFTPRIFTPNGIYQGLPFDMNNLPECVTNSVAVDGFVPQNSYEISAYFTINIPDINSEISNALFMLNCNTEYGCHNGITMIFLVAEDATTDESYVIFASCVSVGCTGVPIGTINSSNNDPVFCENEDPENPVGDCNDMTVTTSGCILDINTYNENDLAGRELATWINTILTQSTIMSGSFDINGTFNSSKVITDYLPNWGSNVQATIGVIRNDTNTIVSIVISSPILINLTPVILSLEFNVSNPSINPYNNITAINSVGGWMAPYLGVDCNSLQIILN